MDVLRASPADKRIRALSHLRSLERILRSEPIGRGLAIAASHLSEYDQALTYLTDLGESVEEFRFPKKEVIPPRGRGGEFLIDRDRLYGLVTALIDYFAISQAVLDLAEEMKQHPEGMIGFKPT